MNPHSVPSSLVMLRRTCCRRPGSIAGAGTCHTRGASSAARCAGSLRTSAVRATTAPASAAPCQHRLWTSIGMTPRRMTAKNAGKLCCREEVTSTSGGLAGPAVVEAAREWYWRRVPTVVSAGRAVWALSSASSRAQAKRVRARCWSLPLPRALSSRTGIFPQCPLRCCTLREGLACYACNLA